MDDCLVCYGQNGEPLRPQQGFPLRLIVPGFEGIFQTKYLRRIKVVDRYYMTYNDYGHINPDPKVSALANQIGPKSVITFPSGGQKLPGPGILRDQRPGLVRRGRGSQGGSFHRRREELEGRRASDAGLSDGAYPLRLPLEVGRQRVHAACRAAPTNWARCNRREPRSPNTGTSRWTRTSASRGADNTDSTVENRQRWERAQWHSRRLFTAARRSWAAAPHGRSLPDLRRWEDAERRRNPGLGYFDQSHGKGTPRRARHRQGRRAAF